MKNKIIVITGIVVIFVIGWFSAQAWHSQKVQQQISSARAAAAHSYTVWKRDQAVKAEKVRLQTECQKSKTYYEKLTAKEKAALPAPNCDLQIVE